MQLKSKFGGPLADITVIDLTTFLSGPFCTQILGDLGARVIKIEAISGDLSRHIPPHFVEDESAYFLGNNRNKESIAIDLKSEEGQAVARKLIDGADVVVENFRPGVAARLGLDSEVIRAEKPELIWASISGFGQNGPNRDSPAYDMIVQALSGVMSLTGEPDGAPVRLGIPAGDLVAGLYAVIGILAAVHDQKVNGTGETIDVSMLDGQLSMLSYQAVYTMISGESPLPQGSFHDSIPTYRSFYGSDERMFVVTANTERMWTELATVIGRADLVSDPRFETAKTRLINRDQLWEILEAAFSTDTAANWVNALQARSVPSALIQNVHAALEDAKQSGRGMVEKLVSPSGSEVDVLNTPIQFSNYKLTGHQYPPALGGNSREILSELGFDRDAIDELLADRIIVGEH